MMRTSHSTRNWTKHAILAIVAVMALVVVSPSPAGGATAPSLGTGETYAVLGGSTVTNTGATFLTGDLGVSPGSAIADVGAITVSGATHAGDAEALQAQTDVGAAYDFLSDEACTDSFTGTAVEIGNQTLLPGVYCYSSSALLTGTLTLHGDGVYIFKTVSELTTAANSTVELTGGAQACNVFWQIGSSATLFTDTTFVGSILAVTQISLQNGASIEGRALARDAAVTMDTNVITVSSCALAATPTATATSTATPAGAGTATSTPSTGATATPDGGAAPTATTVPSTGATPTPPASFPPGPPPAAPIEPAAPPEATPPTGAIPPPDAPRFPNAGAGSERSAPTWLFAMITLLAGSLTIGIGARVYQARA
jgi:hypothetical protein